MINHNNLLAEAIVVAIIVCSVSLAYENKTRTHEQTLTPNFSVPKIQEDVIFTMTEYLGNNDPIATSTQSNMINLTGFWDMKTRNVITISFEADKTLISREQLLNYSKGVV